MDWDAVKDVIRGPAALQMPPFNDDLSLNVAELKKIIRRLYDAGFRRRRGFIICPSGTGEFMSLTLDEHVQMVKAAVEATDGELPVVAGMATARLHEAIEMAQALKNAGATALMVPPPFYYMLDEDSFFTWYQRLTSAVEIGVMIYDQTWRKLGTGVSLGMMERLATLPNLISLKYGNWVTYTDLLVALQRFSRRFAFIDVSLALTATISHIHGAQGYIAGPATVWPEFELHRWDLMEAGQYVEAERFGARLVPFMHRYLTGDEFGGDFVFHDGATFKAMLEYVGLYGGPVRPPFRALNQKEKDDLFAMLDTIDFTVPS
ncbi:MAG: dihydrodipicolinate synthase family protein [Chloroflexota bacterium]|jgi:4-hydroxy-tetrahydrodipicolinate synthase